MAGTTIAIVLIALALLTGFALSPWPVVLLMRHGFGGSSHAGALADLAGEDVEVRRDLIFPSSQGRNRYDLYLPPDNMVSAARGRCPVVVWIHGGAFVAGSKDGVEPWGHALAARGYVVAAPDYAWVPKAAYPAQGRQLQEFLGELKVRAAAGAVPVDPHLVVLAGDSAGAFLAAQAALIATDTAYARRIGIPSALAPEDVRATLLFCGPYSIETILAHARKPSLRFLVNRLGWAFFGTPRWRRSPLLATTAIGACASSVFPPSFISDGNGFSFERNGRELEQSLAARGVPTASLFFPVDGLGVDDPIDHEFQMNLASPAGKLAWERATAFLDRFCPSLRDGRRRTP